MTAPIDEPILQFFRWDHLPRHLQTISSAFGHLAYEVVEKVPRNPERTVALRKLLEAKDAAVRAVLYLEAHTWLRPDDDVPPKRR